MAKPILNELMEWENGSMTEEEEIKLFQKLIDSGMAWTLQGMYGRRAMFLIKIGICYRKGEK